MHQDVVIALAIYSDCISLDTAHTPSSILLLTTQLHPRLHIRRQLPREPPKLPKINQILPQRPSANSHPLPSQHRRLVRGA